MIIVEGFDGSGKTTLCEHLATAMGWPVQKCGGPTRDAHDLRRWLDRGYQAMREKSVKDRTTCVSESVYQSLSDPARSAMALHAITDLQRITTSHRLVLVYCRPPTSFLIDALITHKDKAHDTPAHMEKVRRQAMWMIEYYDTVIALAARQRVRIVTYDRTKQKPEAVIKQAQSQLRGVLN